MHTFRRNPTNSLPDDIERWAKALESRDTPILNKLPLAHFPPSPDIIGHTPATHPVGLWLVRRCVLRPLHAVQNGIYRALALEGEEMSDRIDGWTHRIWWRVQPWDKQPIFEELPPSEPVIMHWRSRWSNEGEPDA